MSNDLTITDKSARVVSNGCSEALSRLLIAKDGKAAVSEITADPELHDEAKRLAPVLRDRARGAGKAGVIAALMPLTAVYGIGDKSDREWETFWAQYIRALSDLPISALEAAADAYNKLPEAEFFPKPGPFRELAIKHNAVGVAAARALAAARVEPSRDFSEAHKADMRRKLAELAKELTRGKVAA